MVLAGGGEVSVQETTEAVRHGWPIIVLKGSGGVADELASLSNPPSRLGRLFGRRRRLDGVPESTLERIVRDGDLRVFAGDRYAFYRRRRQCPTELARWLIWELTDQPVLKDAWRNFAAYNKRATALRRWFARFQAVIIILGVLVTVVGLSYNAFGGPILRWASIITPSVIVVIVALVNRRAAGKRWILLRAGAEAIKVEIYRYRTRTGQYKDSADSPDSEPLRAERLADELETIDRRLVETEASSAPLAPDDDLLPPGLNGMRDDGVTDLDAARYVEHRVADQLSYYRGRVKRLNRWRNLLQGSALIAGASGTIVAAAGAEPWIAVTTAVSAGAISYLSMLQLDNLIVVYNQSAARLGAIRRHWTARDPSARDQDVLEKMVAQAETVLTGELTGWTQQMNTALKELERLASEANKPTT